MIQMTVRLVGKEALNRSVYARC